MKTTRVFKSGHSQAVRLPKEFQFSVDEVEIFRRNNEIIIREKPKNLAKVVKLLAQLSEHGALPLREDSLPQDRTFF